MEALGGIFGGKKPDTSKADAAAARAEEANKRLVELQEKSQKAADDKAAKLDAELAARKRATRSKSTGSRALLTGDELGVQDANAKPVSATLG